MNKLNEVYEYNCFGKVYKCKISMGLYPQAVNKNAAIFLRDPDDNSCICKCTYNPDYTFPQTHVCIKDWSENNGVLDFLINNELIDVNGKMHKDLYNRYLDILKEYKEYEKLNEYR